MARTSFSVAEGAEYNRPSYNNTISCAPSYSSLPLPDEETVQYTPRRGTLITADGTYTKSWKSMTLTLHGQPSGVQRPTYDRHALVAGELEMKRPDRILAVSVKLEGKVTIAATGVGARVSRTVLEDVVLWDKTGLSSRCPGILSFSFRLPSSFSENGESWKLPPTFEPDFMPVVFVKSTYNLTITLTRVVKRLVSWVNVKTYGVLVEYIPRNRPSHPLPRFDSICSSIKSLPDEWTQLVSTMEATPGPGIKPIDCHFLVPANSTHALSDSIPFHIQLSSSLDTLTELLPPSSDLLRPVQPMATKATRGVFAIRVYIARQITVEIHGKISSRTVTIGSGTIWPVPPADLGRGTGPGDDVCLDWEGEAKCFEGVKSGGFSIGFLHVRDYVVLALNPPPVKTCPLLPMQIAHPVKFVTDPWSESDTLHPRDY